MMYLSCWGTTLLFPHLPSVLTYCLFRFNWDDHQWEGKRNDVFSGGLKPGELTPKDSSSEASLHVFYTLKTTMWGKQDFAESYSYMAFNLSFSKSICCSCRVEVSVVKGNIYYGAGAFQLLWPLFCLGDKVKWCLLISDTFIKQANKLINQCLIIVFIYLIPLQHGHRLYYMDGPEFLR